MDFPLSSSRIPHPKVAQGPHPRHPCTNTHNVNDAVQTQRRTNGTPPPHTHPRHPPQNDTSVKVTSSWGQRRERAPAGESGEAGAGTTTSPSPDHSARPQQCARALWSGLGDVVVPVSTCNSPQLPKSHPMGSGRAVQPPQSALDSGTVGPDTPSRAVAGPFHKL